MVFSPDFLISSSFSKRYPALEKSVKVYSERWKAHGKMMKYEVTALFLATSSRKVVSFWYTALEKRSEPIPRKAWTSQQQSIRSALFPHHWSRSRHRDVERQFHRMQQSVKCFMVTPIHCCNLQTVELRGDRDVKKIVRATGARGGKVLSTKIRGQYSKM